MAKVQDPQMLTANRLRDGEVLYWRAGNWVLTLAEGEVFADPKAADAALAAAARYVKENSVVAPYLFDVRVADGVIKPVKEREIIRARGPTVRGEGKQALGAFDVSI
ncbi:MAG: DUF2849 domain-containing protein [Alphaproteobacteria bacterium]|nr:DUF2849 domain-containing protein [Alphaproteobacteria bacterium]MBL7097867.1 DUF2849 domain-containing protein [Alphaproteobacteria bacterium]